MKSANCQTRRIRFAEVEDFGLHRRGGVRGCVGDIDNALEVPRRGRRVFVEDTTDYMSLDRVLDSK